MDTDYFLKDTTFSAEIKTLRNEKVPIFQNYSTQNGINLENEWERNKRTN